MVPADAEPDDDSLALRELLEADASWRFRDGGVADVPISRAQLDRRLAAIQRGLVAHAALNLQLSIVDPEAQPPRSLREAIDRAKREQLITDAEWRWLSNINLAANAAKHETGLPVGIPP